MNQEKIDILLSTYNGEQFISEQIESIINQSHQNWCLIIRDDGSTDNTVEIIKQFERLDKRINFIEDNIGNLKPAMSFFELMKTSKSEILMFCDQDDIWLERKIECTLNNFMKMNKDQPCLVFTDLVVVDEELNTICDSFIKRQNLKSSNSCIFNKEIFQNVVTGCTMMFNRKLVNHINLEKNQNIVMHDWWLTLVALLYGKVSYLDQRTIKYRQHNSNELGSKGTGLKHYYKMIKNKQFSKPNEYIDKITKQAIELKILHKEQMNKDQLKQIGYLIEFGNSKRLINFIKCFLNGVSFGSFSNNFMMAIVLMFKVGIK